MIIVGKKYKTYSGEIVVPKVTGAYDRKDYLIITLLDGNTYSIASDTGLCQGSPQHSLRDIAEFEEAELNLAMDLYKQELLTLSPELAAEAALTRASMFFNAYKNRNK